MISLSLPSSAHRRPFQRSLVRTSTSCYRSFTLAKDSSHGLRVQRKRLRTLCSNSLSLRIPFLRLCSPPALTRGLIMQKANGRVTNDSSIACRRTISGLFHSPPGVLFAFPSRYWFTIGHHGVFSLGEWSPRIQTEFHVFRPTWDTHRSNRSFRLRGYHPLWPFFPEGSANLTGTTTGSRNPGWQAIRFRLLRVRSPLLAQSRLLSSP